MLQRAALGAGEHTGIQLFAKFFPGKNQTAAGTTKGLMGGGGDDVRIGNGAHMGTAGNQTGNVGHIRHKDSANLMGNVCKDLEINGSGIGRGTGNDQLGIALSYHIPDLVIVNVTGLVVYVIGDNIVILAGQIGRAAVGQMTAVGQAHAHHGVTGLQQCQLDGHVGLGTGVGLYIGKFRTETGLGTVNAELLNFINKVASAVITLSGQAFGILIGQNGAHGRHHRRRSKVLGSNQFQTILLAGKFPVHHGSQFRIKL